MSDQQHKRSNSKSKAVRNQIIVAGVTALLFGSTAPWWWDKVIPPPQPEAPSTAATPTESEVTLQSLELYARQLARDLSDRYLLACQLGFVEVPNNRVIASPLYVRDKLKVDVEALHWMAAPALAGVPKPLAVHIDDLRREIQDFNKELDQPISSPVFDWASKKAARLDSMIDHALAFEDGELFDCSATNPIAYEGCGGFSVRVFDRACRSKFLLEVLSP